MNPGLLTGILLSFISLFVTAQNSSNDCKKFQTGRFIIESDPDIRILRSEHFQIEWDSNTGSTSWYKIKWLDNCTYQAELIKTDDDSEIILHELILIIEITEALKDSFKYKVHLKGTDVYDEGEMKKVRALN